MSFKRKQIMGLGLTVFFMFILMFVILSMVNGMKANMLEIVEDRYYKVNQATEIRQLFYQTDQQLLSVLTDIESADPAMTAELIEANHEGIQTRILKLEDELNRQESSLLLKEVEQAYESYAQMQNSFIGLMGSGDLDSLEDLYRDERENRNSLLVKLAEFKEYQESIMADSLASANETYSQLVSTLVAAVAIAIILIVGVTVWVIRSTGRSISLITKGIKGIDYQDLSSISRLNIETKDEIGEIAIAFNSMADSLENYYEKEQRYSAEISEQNWIQSQSAALVSIYSQHVTIANLADDFISRLAPAAGANLGVFYVKDDSGSKPVFKKQAAYADGAEDAGRDFFFAGEGIAGQTVRDKKTIFLHDVPEDYKVLSTGLGDVRPKSIMMAPVMLKDEVVAVVELASLRPFTDAQIKLLEKVIETLGIAITNISGRMEIERLLAESQAQTEELQAQAEELQSQSEELQAQSEEMQSQSEELRMINEQLEERSRDAEMKSEELQAAKEELEEKAKQLSLSSKYKSEFLANMSHELRTPLNSILLLSEMLAEDPDQMLTEEQKEFSKVIHTSGQDLLTLINDILDLSKVEVGKLEISFEEVNMGEMSQRMKQHFTQVAKHKNLEFTVSSSEEVPPVFHTDEQRLQQIVKNLLSNAFKFTEEGSVAVTFEKAAQSDFFGLPLSAYTDDWLKITVLDTGIGIPAEKQQLIFEAFQQADGATMRKYGGTGLGLSISKEFAQLLGGICKVESEEGKGSRFTLVIPNLPNGMPEIEAGTLAFEEAAVTAEPLEEVSEAADPPAAEGNSEADHQHTGTELKDKTVIVVDDDHRNIYALKNALNKEGMNVLTAENGMQCLDLIMGTEKIDIVLMDIMMPVMDGYETMKRLRGLDRHQDVPIIALTAKAMKGDREKCMEAGATDYISKPLKLDQLLSVMRVWLS
ncbi:ATP-binding protein [Cytobacillus firmus]|nr:ATP-binding protein [Cytobacillus firmus]